jgi:hypothetical protein
MTVIDQSLTHSEFFTVDNTPQAFGRLSEQPDLAARSRDAALQAGHRAHPVGPGHLCPQRGGGALGRAGGFWLPHRVALAMHLPQGRHFTFGVDRDQAAKEPRP